LIYSLDTITSNTFDPIDLDTEITPSTILATLSQKSYLQALIMSFRLNEGPLIRTVYESIPPTDIRLLVSSLPQVYLTRLLRLVATQASETPHLEFCLRWIEAILRSHGRYIKDNKGNFAVEVRMVQRVVANVRAELGRLGDENVYYLEYLLSQAGSGKSNKVNGTGGGAVKRIGNGDGGRGMEVDVDDRSEEEEWIGLD
jgi:periodic tryptophan protein 2